MVLVTFQYFVDPDGVRALQVDDVAKLVFGELFFQVEQVKLEVFVELQFDVGIAGVFVLRLRVLCHEAHLAKALIALRVPGRHLNGGFVELARHIFDNIGYRAVLLRLEKTHEVGDVDLLQPKIAHFLANLGDKIHEHPLLPKAKMVFSVDKLVRSDYQAPVRHIL